MRDRNLIVICAYTNVLISAALNSIFCLQQLKLQEVILNQYEQCVTWSRWCVGGHRSRVRLAWMAEDSLKAWLVYWSDTTGWQLCLVVATAAAAAAESLADNTAASSVARFLLQVSVFWRSRRGPHLHDGIHHTTICMNWWSRENCGKREMQFCMVKKKTTLSQLTGATGSCAQDGCSRRPANQRLFPVLLCRAKWLLWGAAGGVTP